METLSPHICPSSRGHLKTRIDQAVSWLLDSGIQEELSGGVRRWYRKPSGFAALFGRPGQYGNVSTELTAYFLGGLRCGGKRYSTAAAQAAEFICDQWTGRFLPFEQLTDKGYYFDTGMAARALYLQGLRITGKACTDSLRFGCAVDPEPHFSDWWSLEFRCYELKAATAHLLYGDTASYRRVRDFCIGDAADFLETAPSPVDYVHPYCYFLEGLLAEPDRDLLARGIDKAAKVLRAHVETFERSDAYAQLLRLRFFCDAAGLVPVDHASSAAELACLLSFQHPQSRDKRVSGGFYFGRRDGKFLPHVNPCSTVFAIQAVQMAIDHAAGMLKPDWREIV